MLDTVNLYEEPSYQRKFCDKSPSYVPIETVSGSSSTILPTLLWAFGGPFVQTICTIIFTAHQLYRLSVIHATYPSAPNGMVFVPAGRLFMGSGASNAQEDEKPFRRRFTDRFFIDKYEVTNRDGRQFRTDFAYPEGTDDLPVTHFLKREAQDYARFVGKRLPTPHFSPVAPVDGGDW